MADVERTYSETPTPRIQHTSKDGFMFDYGTVNVKEYTENDDGSVTLLADETELDNDLPVEWVEQE